MTELWEIKRVEYGTESEWLKQGWEPFSTTSIDSSYNCSTPFGRERQSRAIIYIFLRRKIEVA